MVIEELDAKREELREAERAARDIGSARTIAPDVEPLRLALVQAHASGDQKQVAAAQKKLDAVVNRQLPSAEEEAGATLAAQRKRAELTAWLAEHYGQVRDEYNERANAVSDRLDHALQEVALAHRERELCSQAGHELLALLVARVRLGTIPHERAVVEHAAVDAGEALAAGSRPPTLPQSYLPEMAEPVPELEEAW